MPASQPPDDSDTDSDSNTGEDDRVGELGGQQVGFYCRACREPTPYADHAEVEHDPAPSLDDYDTTNPIIPIVAVDGAYYAQTQGACAPTDHEFEAVGSEDECVACGSIRFTANPITDGDSRGS